MSTRFGWNAVLLIATFLPACWLLMMVVHEFGHVVAGWLTGGTIERVVLHPIAISRTDLGRNPHPAIVCWAGPVLGVAIPLIAWTVWERANWPLPFLWRFFAGFCFVANGVYIGVGSFERVGDAGDLQSLGSPIWALWIFGVVTVPVGFWLWNGLGTHFGLRGGSVPRSTALFSISLLTLVILLEILL